MYVAFILDVFAQRIVAWSVAATKAVELFDVPLRMELWQRGREGIRPSVGSVADAYNALMECVIDRFKTECIRTIVFHPGPYRTLGDVEYPTAGWVDWYNNRRLHGTLGMLTPVEFEQAHYAALNREPQPV